MGDLDSPAPRGSTRCSWPTRAPGSGYSVTSRRPGSSAVTRWRTVPPLRSFTRTSDALGELALGLDAARPAGPSRASAPGFAHRAQTALAGALRALACGSASNTPAQVGSGEPAKAKNQIIIAIEATTAVPTKTASTGLSFSVPGR